MLVEADLALYQTKHDGRDGYSFYSTSLERKARDRPAMSEEIRAAIANDELEVYYQPQVEISSGRIVGMEALLRWDHPQRGLLLPASFLPIAVTTGAIHSIGQWVLEQVCQQIGRWQREGIDPPRLAISISAAQLKVVNTLDEQIRNRGPLRHRSRPNRDRADRSGIDRIEQDQDRYHSGPASTGDQRRDRRFQNRLFVARLAAYPPAGPAQDRAAVHAQFADRTRRRRDRPRSAGAGARVRHGSDRRRRRDRRSTGVSAERRLSFRAGVILQPPGAGGRGQRTVAGRQHQPPPAAKPADSVRLLVG